MAEVEILAANKEIEKLFLKVQELNRYEQFYEKIKYLNFLKNPEEHEKFFFENYSPTLKLAGTTCRTFTDFSQGNYDTLTRLKWKWLN